MTTDNHELTAGTPPVIEVQLDEPAKLFEVNQAEVARIFPVVVAGAETLAAMMRGGNPAWEKGEREDEEPDPDKPVITRSMIRENLGIYQTPMRRLIRAGAALAASYDDPDEGDRVGKQILSEMSDEMLMPFWDNNVKRMSGPLRTLRQLSVEARTQIDTEGEKGVEARYAMLKMLGADAVQERSTISDHHGAQAEDWKPSVTLGVFICMTDSDIQRRLTSEMASGAYDALIAKDILNFVAGKDRMEDTDLERVRQLSMFLTAFTGQAEGDQDAFIDRMVAVLDTWPFDAHAAVTGMYTAFSNALNVNLGRSAGWLKNNNLLGGDTQDELAAAFEGGIVGLINEFAKRVPTMGPYKAEIMRMRAAQKRRKLPGTEQGDEIRGKRLRKTRKGAGAAAVAAETEERRDPYKIVTCNLNDHTVTEGVEALIEKFLENSGGTSDAIRVDLERMLSHMARRDLPANQRRGVKSINGSKVRFGDDHKLWDFSEFKPTGPDGAAGLSLRTNAAKNSRIYFIRYDDDTLGVIGIEPKSEQDAFLRHIRVKVKRRPEEG